MLNMKRYIILLIAISILFLSCNNLYSGNIPPEVNKGVLDLRNWDFETDGPVNLSGEWEFYWKKLLMADDFSKEKSPKISMYINVPGEWNTEELNGETLPAAGYATYRIKILLKEKTQMLSLKFSDMATAFYAYANGKKISSAGKVGDTSDKAVSHLSPEIADFISQSGQIELIIQMSSFDYYSSGFWYNAVLGTPEQIREIWGRNLIRIIFLVGSIFIIGLYHLIIFLLKRKEKAPLYFGLFCLSIALRNLVMDEKIAVFLINDLPFEILKKCDYTLWYLALLSLGIFLYKIFPKEFSKKILNVIFGLTVTASLLTIVTPASINSYIVSPFLLLTGVIGLYYNFVVILAVKRKRLSAIAFLIGSLVLLVAVLNDILKSFYIIDTIIVTPAGLIFFIIAQAYGISQRFSNALSTSENLTTKIEEDNKNLTGILGNIQNASNELADFSTTLTATAEGLQEEMTNQGSNLEQTSAAIEELSMSIGSIVTVTSEQDDAITNNNIILEKYIQSLKEITEAAKNAEVLSNNSREQTDQSKKSLDEIITGMEGIKGSSSAIGEITEIINDISDQTNLLSLNASIEAARAGEHGKGFAVVAEEIGKLAQKTIEQAKSIQDHIQQTVNNIDNETHIVMNSSTVIMNISEAVDEVKLAVSSILERCVSQENEAQTVLDYMDSISKGSAEITKATSEQKTTMHEVTSSIEYLNEIMNSVINKIDTLTESMNVLQKEIDLLKDMTG